MMAIESRQLVSDARCLLQTNGQIKSQSKYCTSAATLQRPPCQNSERHCLRLRMLCLPGHVEAVAQEWPHVLHICQTVQNRQHGFCQHSVIHVAPARYTLRFCST